MFGNTLFLAGTLEAQKLVPYNLDLRQFLSKHFVYSVLLSERVMMPIGSFYQSENTQYLTDRFYGLFLPYRNEPPLVGFSIGSDKGSFHEDALDKASWFPKGYSIYSDQVAINELSKRLTMEPWIRSGKMRDVLTSKIKEDIGINGQSRLTLNKFISKELSGELVKPLEKVVEVQKYAILPEYVHMEMGKFSDNPIYKKWLDFILHKGYAISCSETYDAYCNNPLSVFYQNIFRKLYPYSLNSKDTLLFSTFLDIFPFEEIENIENKSVDKIIELKRSNIFSAYLTIYEKVISKLKEIFNMYILDFQNYSLVKSEIKRLHESEKIMLKKSLINDINSSIILYRSLKYSFKRAKHIKNWIKFQDLSELPTLEILTYLDCENNDLINEFMKELFLISKINYKNWEANMEHKKNNRIFAIHSVVNQDVKDSQTLIASTIGSAAQGLIVQQDEFNEISWNDIEKFIELLKQEKINDKTKQILIELLASGKYSTKTSYNENLNKWNQHKSSLTNDIKDRLATLAQLTNIATFILKLLGI
ncbi:hypothetical protein D7X25_14615 [bacterium 1XD42-8]|nr:hypothetical protein D7X25_14615 [bacterium 1XD42-8]